MDWENKVLLTSLHSLFYIFIFNQIMKCGVEIIAPLQQGTIFRLEEPQSEETHAQILKQTPSGGSEFVVLSHNFSFRA